MGWGQNAFTPIRHMVAARRLTEDSQFYDAALLAIDWMHGANPQGRVNTTGLGHHYVIASLHLPSFVDRFQDPVPGISTCAYTGSIPFSARTQVYGLFADPLPGLQFTGSALAQLPSPWNDTELGLDAIGTILYDKLPLWRRLVALEASNVEQSEFTVDGTISPAAAVTGCLMGAGWKPSDELLSRLPRTGRKLRDSLWYQP